MTNIIGGGSALENLKKRDLHVHTTYCNHATGEMEEYVLAAIKAGLEEIGFLEHVEAGADMPRRVWMKDEDIPRYWEQGQRLKEKYRDRIKVGVGLEVGVNPDHVEYLLSVIKGCQWDHIGLSCHLVRFEGGFLNISSRSSLEVLESADHKLLSLDYYGTLRDHIRIFQPDFVCHLDLPRKFMTDLSRDPEVWGLIRAVLEEMWLAGAALEVNTSGYTWTGAPYPGVEILRAATALGLGLVLNSDSHHPSEVGRRFDEALGYLASTRNGDGT
jgi:histidinol-phosphatase (PHP family)